MGKASRKKKEKRLNPVIVPANNSAGISNSGHYASAPRNRKISFALSVLLDAVIAQDALLEDYKAALDLVVIAWNISLLDADERQGAIQETLPLVKENESIRREYIARVEHLIAMKIQNFQDDRRVIVSWDVNFEDANCRVTAAAMSVE